MTPVESLDRLPRRRLTAVGPLTVINVDTDRNGSDLPRWHRAVSAQSCVKQFVPNPHDQWRLAECVRCLRADGESRHFPKEDINSIYCFCPSFSFSIAGHHDCMVHYIL